MTEHETTPVRVIADIDIGVAPLVAALQQYDGIRTLSSCENVGGRAYVMIAWEYEEAIRHLGAVIVAWNDSSVPAGAPGRFVTLDDWRPGNSLVYLHVPPHEVEFFAGHLVDTLVSEARAEAERAQRDAEATTSRVPSDTGAAQPLLEDAPGA